MKSAAVVFLGVLAVAVAGLAADQSWDKWSSVAALTVSGGSPGLREVELPPAVLDAARGDLADLRIVDAAGAEIPYVVVQRRRQIATEKIAATLFDRAYTPNKEGSVVADFSEKMFKDEVEVDTAGLDFRRRVRVEGGDDGKTWKVVRNGALLYRASSAGGFEVKRVDLPRNDFRYLRITVFNSADDPARIEFRGVTMSRRIGEIAPPEIPVAPAKIATAEDKTETVVTFDVGVRNARINTITLAVADPNFWRRVRVFARDSEKRMVRIRREDGAAFDKEEDVPWNPLGGDLIYRLADDESLAVHLHGANYRLFQLRIDNQNDKPLTIDSVKIFREPVDLQFQAEPGRELRLYFGAAEATAPAYDLARFVGDLRKAGVQPAMLGAVSPNPAYKKAAPPEKTWSERYAGLLWIALIAVGAGMAWLVWRQVRAAKNMPAK